MEYVYCAVVCSILGIFYSLEARAFERSLPTKASKSYVVSNLKYMCSAGLIWSSSQLSICNRLPRRRRGGLLQHCHCRLCIAVPATSLMGPVSYVACKLEYFCHKCTLSKFGMWHICGI